MFYSGFQPVHEPGVTRGRGLHVKRYRLCGYAGKLTVNSRLDINIKIVIIWKASSWETFLKNSGLPEEATQVERLINGIWE